VRERLRGVHIECLDFEKLITRNDRVDTFFYLDPPYTVTAKGGYYEHEFKEEDHRRLAALLKGVQGKWLLSYDDAPLIRSLYRGFKIEETKPVAYSLTLVNGQRPHKRELLIRNY
jgi:DNA adenine methylase